MDDYPTRADEVRETWKRKEKPVTPVERLMALENAVELVAKATPGPWMVSDHNEGEMHPLWCVDNEAFHTGGDEDQPLMVSVQYGGKEDAEAIRAAVNFIREHGSALIADLGQEVGAVAPLAMRIVLPRGSTTGWESYDAERAANLSKGWTVELAYSSPAHTSEARDGLKDEDVEWIVNDLAELGVKIGSQFFFCYKGRSLIYEEATHDDDGRRMKWRPVFKREFGECVHPVNYEDLRKCGHQHFIGTVSLDDSGEWKDLPDAAMRQEGGE